jgi:hypothetical protein
LAFGAGDKIDRVADVFLSLLDRVSNRLHHGNAKCHCGNSKGLIHPNLNRRKFEGRASAHRR